MCKYPADLPAKFLERSIKHRRARIEYESPTLRQVSHLSPNRFPHASLDAIPPDRLSYGTRYSEAEAGPCNHLRDGTRKSSKVATVHTLSVLVYLAELG